MVFFVLVADFVDAFAEGALEAGLLATGLGVAGFAGAAFTVGLVGAVLVAGFTVFCVAGAFAAGFAVTLLAAGAVFAAGAFVGAAF